jgi:alpha-beta hydrolase superfamily lysophospholipase
MFPIPPGADWTEHTVSYNGGSLTLRARVRRWEDKIVSAAQIAAFAFTEEVLPLAGGEAAVLQSRTAPAHDKAVLWFPGRNDAFFHPHVGEAFAARGYDVHVLNYRRVGACRRAGLFANPYLNSHCASADFAEYHEEIDMALARLVALKNYTRTIAYAFSTGAPILLDYLSAAEYGGPFSGIVLNSPFVDWGQGGPTEFFLTMVPRLLLALPFVKSTLNVDPSFDPKGWSSRGLVGHADYEFDPRSKPLYQVPVTAGFAEGANKVHVKLRALKDEGRILSAGPALVLSSDADDVLDAEDIAMMERVISADVTTKRFAANSHDVFVSDDPADNDAALAQLDAWIAASGH